MKRKKPGPGASWSTSGRNNRKPREDGSSCNPQIRAAVLAEFALNGIKREARRAAKGTTPAKRVIHCPGCGCPVVDSLLGRERHVQRSAACSQAWKQAGKEGPMEIWKVEAEGDTVYIKAESLDVAKTIFKKNIGIVPESLLTWTKVDGLPEGEEFL